MSCPESPAEFNLASLKALSFSALVHGVLSAFLPLSTLVHVGVLTFIGLAHLALFEAFRRHNDSSTRQRDNCPIPTSCPAPQESIHQLVDERTRELSYARDEALELATRKSQFLANMSHELRTPLNAISGLVDICLGTGPTPKQRNYLEKIDSSAQALLRLVNDVLDFSKADAGHIRLERIPFDMKTVLNYLETMLLEKAFEHQVELVVDCPSDSDDHVFLGDPMRIEQILLNLVSNAIKFSHKGGTVFISVQVTPQEEGLAQLSLLVRDTGIGLSQEQQARLFTPFAQADASTTRKYGGTGLGLAICKNLTELMNGRISVSSTEGAGSTFTVELPIEVRRAEDEEQHSDAKAFSPYQGHRVLVVEDNEGSRKRLCTHLEALGLTCVSHFSGESAVASLAASANPGQYLAAFVDNTLTGLSGIETCRRLRDVAPKLPLILMSSTNNDDQVAHGAKAGFFDGSMLKPVRNWRAISELSILLGLAERTAAGAAFHAEHPPESLSGCTVLVVDDVPVNQEILKGLLENIGVHVLEASNGLEALRAVERRRPDAILMDCQMPVMDGYEACRQLKASALYRAIPVIAVTAHASDEDRKKCREVGMVGYLPKPIRAAAVYTELSQHIRKPVPVLTTPQEPELEALKGLPHIDVAEGLKNCASPQLYAKTLRIVRDTHVVTFEQEFKQALDAGRSQEALRLAHSLKGVARTIGAANLGEAALGLELAMRSAVASPDIEKHFANVLQELGLVAESLNERFDELALY